ncbi:MAG: hypothetical protein WAT71_12620 [Ignavibacteria bacterium]
MKRTFLFLAAVILTAFMLSDIQGVENKSDLNEIKNVIQYSPDDDWVVEAYIGTTLYGSCGPTSSSGVCAIVNLPEGTYTLKVTKNDCTGTQTVYHPGTGDTIVTWGPVNPTLNCAR